MRWITIVAKDIKSMMREKIAWFTMILLPLVVLVIAGFSLSGLFSQASPDLILAYSFQGEDSQIEPLLHGLEEMKSVELVRAESKEDGFKMIENSSVTALIDIPLDFSVKDVHKDYKIDYYYDISSQSTSDILKGIVQGIVKSLDNSLSAVKLVVNTLEEQNLYQETMLPEIVGEVQEEFHHGDCIEMVATGIGGEEENRSFYQVIPGFAVMFLLFSIMGGSTKLIEERQNKTLRRILVSPGKKRDIIIAKWIGMTLEGFVQSIILFLTGALLFKISLGNNPFRLVIFLLVTAAASGAIGVFIASVSKSLKQATSLSMLLFMLMSALGGSWWPLDITPSFMQTAGHFTFNYWVISGIKKLILFNQSLTGVGLELLVIVVIGAVFLLLSFRKFKFE